MGPLVCVEDYEEKAETKMHKSDLDFYNRGATAETTLKENKEALSRWYILPRFLRDVSRRNQRQSVLGEQLQLPFAAAPIGLLGMAHPKGECAAARACASHGTIYTLSTLSNSSIEEVASAAPDAVKYFQVYIYKDRSLTAGLVRRAEAAGYKALVLTIDAPVISIRRRDIRNNFQMPPHLKMSNFDSTAREGTIPTAESMKDYFSELFDCTISWADIAWLKRISSLPVVVKGVLDRKDARLALQAGVAAIWVSNHGGRQADCVSPSIEALPHVVAEVGGLCPVFVDGAFMQGNDIFKALALGASMVFVGRPIVWGLACAGEEGVHDVFNIIKDELDNIMANTGCCTIQDIDSSMVIRKELYAKL